jgi:hypothetical protein
MNQGQQQQQQQTGTIGTMASASGQSTHQQQQQLQPLLGLMQQGGLPNMFPMNPGAFLSFPGAAGNPMIPNMGMQLQGFMDPSQNQLAMGALLAQAGQQQAHIGGHSSGPPSSSFASVSGSDAAQNAEGEPQLSAAERAKQNRERNREHARSTRLRKKAYVQKLKELVGGLHSERTEEVRKRRVAVQQLAEVQSLRRHVLRTFLRFSCTHETDERKWATLVEQDFWLKQPVTPFRAFPRAEIEKVRVLFLSFSYALTVCLLSI